MSDLIEQTNVMVKSKRLERNSGKLPSKLRFTSATKISLQKNIDYNFLEKAITKLNTVYRELISAVEVAEKVKAEEEVRSKIQGNPGLEAKIELDEKIAKITSSDVVNKRLKKATIELLKLAGRIGTYKDHYGINAKKGFTLKSPKAINVPKLYADVYKSLESQIDLYILAEKNKKEDGKEEVAVEESTPNWRKLFDGMKKTPSNITIAMNESKEKEKEEEIEFVAPAKGVSQEDISYRKMLGQLGDEFEAIENYEKSPTGIPLQFKDGFESRKSNLSKILVDLTGIEPKANKDLDIKIKDNTEFQNLIDEVNGYREPMSEEEHKRMEDSLNEYYSSEEVSSKINELAEKDVLYTFNQHMEDVIKNESLLNNTNAVTKVEESNKEVEVSSELLEKQREEYELKQGAEEQARMLKSLYDYIDMRDKFEEEKAKREAEERKELLKGAEEQAQRIFDEALIMDGAEEEARRIINSLQKEQEEIEQTNKMIEEGAKAEAHRIFDEALIPESAKEEAQRILNREISAEQEKENIEKMIEEGAKVEAQRIFDEALIMDSAEEEAKKIFEKEVKAQNEQEETNKMIEEGAKAEAQRIFDEALIMDSAEEEAKRILDKEVKALNEQEETNKMIQEGAIEQAKMIQNQNEYADILESAEVQAKILHNKDRKAKLLQDAQALSEQLKSINEETNKIDSLIDKMVDEDSMNDIPTKNESVREEPKESFVADQVIIDSAKEEAKRIYDKKIIAESAEEEAKKLYDRNSLIDGAKEEAQKIFDKNLIAESAEEEARKIYDNNLIVEGAEEEAKRLLNASIVEEKPEVKQEAVEQEVKPEPVPVVSSNNGYELVDNNDRYAELTNKSNALLVKQSRIENINKRTKPVDNSLSKKKEQLQSLKEELESANYSFLTSSEDSIKKVA